MSEPQDDGPFTVEEIEQMNRREAIRLGIDPGPMRDEMAAGIIHEPGTGGDDLIGDGTDYGVTAIPVEDRPEFVKQATRAWEGEWREPSEDAMYAINGLALDAIEHALGFSDARSCQIALCHVRAAREDGPIKGDEGPTPDQHVNLEQDYCRVMALLHAATDARDRAEQQRDFLVGQCSSLIERLAGAQVAAGLINMQAAQGFIVKETLPINHVLAQMAPVPTPPEESQL